MLVTYFSLKIILEHANKTNIKNDSCNKIEIIIYPDNRKTLLQNQIWNQLQASPYASLQP